MKEGKKKKTQSGLMKQEFTKYENDFGMLEV
jgi:hypothetical protein